MHALLRLRSPDSEEQAKARAERGAIALRKPFQQAARRAGALLQRAGVEVSGEPAKDHHDRG